MYIFPCPCVLAEIAYARNIKLFSLENESTGLSNIWWSQAYYDCDKQAFKKFINNSITL
jgi:hypothetical protein